jgi:hypothetical protein
VRLSFKISKIKEKKGKRGMQDKWRICKVQFAFKGKSKLNWGKMKIDE